jgi:hypothetical protein
MIQASFTDLVGTSAVPAHAFDMAELTDLTPALENAAVDHGTSLEASEALATYGCGGPSFVCG